MGVETGKEYVHAIEVTHSNVYDAAVFTLILGEGRFLYAVPYL